MSRGDVHVVGYDEIAGEIWSGLAAAADRSDHPWRWHAFATVGSDHRPNVRTLVLRGAMKKESVLWYHTDIRTPKIAQLRVSPAVSCLCYDPARGIQVRLDGTAIVHHEDDDAKHHWSQFGMAVRYAFGIVHQPGVELARTDPRTHQARKSLTLPREGDGFSLFAVIEVRVDAIDWFQSSAEGQRRCRLERKQGWTPVPLAP